MLSLLSSVSELYGSWSVFEEKLVPTGCSSKVEKHAAAPLFVCVVPPARGGTVRPSIGVTDTPWRVHERHFEAQTSGARSTAVTGVKPQSPVSTLDCIIADLTKLKRSLHCCL